MDTNITGYWQYIIYNSWLKDELTDGSGYGPDVDIVEKTSALYESAESCQAAAIKEVERLNAMYEDPNGYQYVVEFEPIIKDEDSKEEK